MNLRDAWEVHADAWAAWARTPGHDTFFWLHSLPNLVSLLPAPGRRTLDLGCGEGRLPRELMARGHQVVGIDSSPTLARLAATHEQRTAVVNGDVAALPIGDATVDLVVASMSLQDVDDLTAAVREAARVLVPDGRLCASIVHPINSAGEFTGSEDDSPFVLTDSYLEERRYMDELTRDGLTMTFHSLHHPIEAYVDALGQAGLRLEALREPPATEEFVAAAPTAVRWQRVPVFLFFRAVKLG